MGGLFPNQKTVAILNRHFGLKLWSDFFEQVSEGREGIFKNPKHFIANFRELKHMFNKNLVKIVKFGQNCEIWSKL